MELEESAFGWHWLGSELLLEECQCVFCDGPTVLQIRDIPSCLLRTVPHCFTDKRQFVLVTGGYISRTRKVATATADVRRRGANCYENDRSAVMTSESCAGLTLCCGYDPNYCIHPLSWCLSAAELALKGFTTHARLSCCPSTALRVAGTVCVPCGC
jgi:hypothetical protein